ncbi:MAG: SOS-response repressor and protease LexA, partial [uncultured Thermomicrobiales bacterium]
ERPVPAPASDPRLHRALPGRQRLPSHHPRHPGRARHLLDERRRLQPEGARGAGPDPAQQQDLPRDRVGRPPARSPQRGRHPGHRPDRGRSADPRPRRPRTQRRRRDGRAGRGTGAGRRTQPVRPPGQGAVDDRRPDQRRRRGRAPRPGDLRKRRDGRGLVEGAAGDDPQEVLPGGRPGPPPTRQRDDGPDLHPRRQRRDPRAAGDRPPLQLL